ERHGRNHSSLFTPRPTLIVRHRGFVCRVNQTRCPAFGSESTWLGMTLHRGHQHTRPISGNFRHSFKAESRKRFVSESPKRPDYAEEKVDFPLVYQWFSNLTRHYPGLGINL